MNDWLKSGNYFTYNDHKIFYRDGVSSRDRPTLLILHGYPTCSYDYAHALRELNKHFRVVLHDHLGFGLSDKPAHYSYSLLEQADVALALWRHLGIERAHVLAHDYGTSIATELLARHEESELSLKLQTLTLCNGSMHIEMAKLRIIQRFLKHRWLGPLVARLSTKRIFRRNLRNVFYDANKLSQDDIDVLWRLMTCNRGRRVLPKVSQYINERYHRWDRWIGALRKTERPINILWAENDPVAVLAMAKVIHDETRNSTLRTLSDCGHFPMIERPNSWVQLVIEGIKANS